MTPHGTDEGSPLSTEIGSGYDWSTDGLLVAVAAGTARRRDISLLAIRGATIAPFIAGPSDEFGARFSPNGRWLAYVSNESGQNEIYVREINPPQRRWRVSTEGGSAPVWSRDGTELFYRERRRLMAVKVSRTLDFVASRPVALFEAPFAGGAAFNYDVGPDGRFLIIGEADSDSRPSELVLVQHWFEELRRKVPAQ